MDLNELIRLIEKGENEKIEFKKKPADINREICAMANADGGYILIGVDDNGNIVGCDIKKTKEKIAGDLQSITPPVEVKIETVKLEDKNVLVVKVPKGEHLSSVGGVVYIRTGAAIRPLSIQEILMLSSELGTITWDEFPVIPRKHMKKEYVEWFFSEMKRTKGRYIPQEDYMKYLKSVKAIKKNMLTNAGVLFFTDAEKFIENAGCRVLTMEKNQPIKSVEFKGPIWKAIEECYSYILAETQRIEVVVGTKTVKIEEYPPRALREGLINAFAHRNYTIPADIRVFIYPDRITIRNPGGLMPGVTLDDPEHVPRNPHICQMLYDVGLVEKYGYGIRMIKRECERHGYVEPVFNVSANKFDLTLVKKVGVLLDETDRRILELIIVPKRSGELAEILGISKPSVLKHLKHLQQLGLVEQIGGGGHIKWTVKKSGHRWW